MPSPPDRELLSVPAAAELAGESTRAIKYRIIKGWLKATRVGKGSRAPLFITRRSLDEYLAIHQYNFRAHHAKPPGRHKRRRSKTTKLGGAV